MPPRQVTQVFKAILHVSPAPKGLVYTGPIYQRLKAFGHIVSFRKEAVSVTDDPFSVSGPPTQGLFHVAFADESGLNQAVSSSPFSVDVGHNHGQLSPRTLDPYNIFGLQQRKPLEPQSFTCQLKRRDVEVRPVLNPFFPNESVVTPPPKVKLVRDERSGPLYKSLLQADIALGQLDGLATSIHYLTDTTEPGGQLEDETPLMAPPTLMERYRSALEKERSEAIKQSEALDKEVEGEVLVPIRKQYKNFTGPRFVLRNSPRHWQPAVLTKESGQPASTETTQDDQKRNERDPWTKRS